MKSLGHGREEKNATTAVTFFAVVFEAVPRMRHFVLRDVLS
jgi:hypothetical protein